MNLDGTERRNINMLAETTNVYRLLDIRAPTGFAIAVSVRFIDNESKSSNGYFYVGDGLDRFSIETDSCYQWQRFNAHAQLISYQSRSPSVKLIFSSNEWNNTSEFLVQLDTFSRSNETSSFVNGKYIVLY